MKAMAHGFRGVTIATALLLPATGTLAQQGADQAPAPERAAQPAARTAVIHLSEFGDDYHAVQMALELANAMQEKGNRTYLLLDVEGVHLAARDTPLGDIRLLGAEEAAAAVAAQDEQIQPVAGAEGEEAGAAADRARRGSFEALYRQFVAGGGQVLVREHCAALAGIGREELRRGARLVDEGQIADILARADHVVDY